MNGTTTPVTGTSNTAETAALTGLTPNTTYYFNIEAVNSVTTTYGAVLNFTTALGRRPPRRAWPGREPRPPPRPSTARSTPRTPRPRSPSVTAPRASLTNCSGVPPPSRPRAPPTATGSSATTESRRAHRPDAGHRIHSSRSRRSTAPAPPTGLGAQLHHAGGGSHRHDQRGDQRQRHVGRPSTARSTPRVPSDNGHLLLQHVEHDRELHRLLSPR